MKLFISYRRKTVHFAQRLVEKLRLYIQDEIFIDLDSVDDDDFEKSILGHLHQSDVILLLVTEFTFADRIHNDKDWVRKEIREALTNDIPIVLICENGLLPPYDLPDDIKMISGKQGINFYPEFFIPAVERLVEFLMKMGVATPKSKQAIADALSAQDETNPFEEQKMAFVDEALPLIESDELDKMEKGIFILEELLKTGYKSRMVDKILAEAQKHRDTLKSEGTAREEYDEIRMAAKFKRTEAIALEEFEAWADRHPHLVEKLDTDNLRSRLPKSPLQNTEAQILLAELDDPNFPHTGRLQVGRRLAEIGDPRQGVGLLPNGIPDIAWCHVATGGNITLQDADKKSHTFAIKPFYVAKYLTTNAQYQAFVDLEDGYKNKAWWKHFPSEYQPQTLNASTNQSPNAPRDSLSWYHSMAFAQWMDAKYRENGLFESILKLPSSQWRITLPPEWYWKWMAQNGTENREYPWGKWDNTPRANTNEAGLNNQSTAVGMYPQGVTGCGALDVAGNLWEWCLNDYKVVQTLNAYSNGEPKVLRGGSFYDGQEIARAMYRFSFDPDLVNSDNGCRLFLLPIVSVL
ncbi:MAG: SUMF1/EgtB/PvdO family nonheme iron enzyme [bacterium]|nr:SUMF1/EgtB/PvdO family nonheme iron enzyme [bacterium]